MFENNSIVKLFNIKYPLIQGGMAGISESKLVSSVSNAGGLGLIGAGLMPPLWLEKEIQKTKELTKNPFGINLFMQNPKVADLLKLIIKERIPVVFTGGGNPLPIFSYLQAAGIKIVPVVPSPRLAKKMEDNGADAIVVAGMESGGHIGKNTTFSLIPLAKKILTKVPLISAGGIYNGKTMAGAMVLGADGVQIGTRFLATTECIISEAYKKRIIEATIDDIEAVLEFTGHPLRVIKNKLFEEIKKMEEKNAFPEEIKSEKIVGSLGGKNVESIPLLCGLCAEGINEIKSVREVIGEIIKDCEEALKGAENLLN